MEHKDRARGASMINIILGVWLVLSPFIFNYTFDTTLMWNSIISGLVIGAIALIRTSDPVHNEWLSWINLLAGLWVFISPFVLNYPTLASRWDHILVGLLTAFLAIRSATETHYIRPAHR